MALPLPPSLEPYSPLIMVVLSFVDGLLLGLAIKKGLLSFILLVAALLLGSYIGISMPGLSADYLISRASYLISRWASTVPLTFSGVSIFFLLGLVVGIWKG